MEFNSGFKGLNFSKTDWHNPASQLYKAVIVSAVTI